MSGITYDTGALLAAEANRADLWAFHRRALARGWLLTVPAAALAQAWRGGPQASLSRLLVACVVEPLDEPCARRSGAACGRSRASDIVDVSVVIGALARGDLVVTSDPDDLLAIASRLGRRLDVHGL